MNKIYGNLTEQIFLDQCSAYGIEWISEEQLIELKKRIKNIKYSKEDKELIHQIEKNILFLKGERDKKHTTRIRYNQLSSFISDLHENIKDIKRRYVKKEYYELKQKEQIK